MSEINSTEFGKLLARADQLERDVTDIRADVKELLAMANRSKGGLWVGMSLAGLGGGALTMLIEKIFSKLV